MKPKLSSPTDNRERLKSLIREKSYITDGDFKLASGASSSFFFDMKMTMLDAEGAALVADLILENIKNDKVKAIGGLELGACPIASAVCARSLDGGMKVDAFYVRKTPKKRGTQKMIEGDLNAGDRVVIVEDVTTSGGSALIAVDEVKKIGCTVVKVITIVDREQGAKDNLDKQGVALEALFSRRDFE